MIDKGNRKLGAEELERRVAPGRITYIEPVPDPDGGGGGGSVPAGDPDKEQPGKSGGRRQKPWQRD